MQSFYFCLHCEYRHAPTVSTVNTGRHRHRFVSRCGVFSSGSIGEREKKQEKEKKERLVMFENSSRQGDYDEHRMSISISMDLGASGFHA